MKSEGQSMVITCPNPKCRRRLRVSQNMAGKKVRCPVETCRTVITVPVQPKPEEFIQVEVVEPEPEPEEDEEEERPRRPVRRKKRRRRSKYSAEYDKVRKQAAGILFAIAGL